MLARPSIDWARAAADRAVAAQAAQAASALTGERSLTASAFRLNRSHERLDESASRLNRSHERLRYEPPAAGSAAQLADPESRARQT